MQDFLNGLVERGQHLWAETATIWAQGGWAMWPIAFIAVLMFATGVRIQLRLRDTGYRRVSEPRWRRWITHPKEREGPIGDLVEFVTAGSTIKEMQAYFQQYRKGRMLPFERDLRVMKVCVSAAPLVGLLGTVSGMLTTFDALATGPGGDKTMSMIAGGISQALITTETGLVIALPGLFFQHMLARKFDNYRGFLAHVETVCTQSLHARSRVGEAAVVDRLAREQIARQLKRALAERQAQTAAGAAASTSNPVDPSKWTGKIRPSQAL